MPKQAASLLGAIPNVCGMLCIQWGQPVPVLFGCDTDILPYPYFGAGIATLTLINAF